MSKATEEIAAALAWEQYSEAKTILQPYSLASNGLAVIYAYDGNVYIRGRGGVEFPLGAGESVWITPDGSSFYSKQPNSVEFKLLEEAGIWAVECSEKELCGFSLENEEGDTISMGLVYHADDLVSKVAEQEHTVESIVELFDDVDAGNENGVIVWYELLPYDLVVVYSSEKNIHVKGSLDQDFPHKGFPYFNYDPVTRLFFCFDRTE